MSIVVLEIVEVSVNKIALWINVTVDYWTANEWSLLVMSLSTSQQISQKNPPQFYVKILISIQGGRLMDHVMRFGFAEVMKRFPQVAVTNWTKVNHPRDRKYLKMGHVKYSWVGYLLEHFCNLWLKVHSHGAAATTTMATLTIGFHCN